MEGNFSAAKQTENQDAEGTKEPSRKMIRELGYIAKAPAAGVVDNRVSRADRVGGLDYYRERKD